jgi:TP901 family phage tail tape measure protein
MASNAGFATLSVIPSFQGFQSALSSGVVGPMATTGKAAGGKLGASMGTEAASKFKRLFGPAIAIAAGASLLKVGDTFNKMSRTIIVGTGASGEALAGLEESAKRIATSAPSSFDDVGTAVSDLNTRLGLSGKPLEELSEKMLDLSRITGTDVTQNIASITRLFGDWSIKTEDQSGALDKLFKASQSTGIGVDKLSQLMVQFGSPLRNLGLDFDYTAAMFSRFEKEGVNIQTAMPGLRMALKNFAAAGREPAPALMETFEAIRDASSAAEANTMAFETFGTRAGPDMAAAIREGRFDLDALVRTLQTSKGAIEDADKRTRTFSESWQLFKNNVLVGLEPLATRTFDGITAGAGRLFPAVQGTAKAFGDLPGPVKAAGAAIAGIQLARFVGLTSRVTSGAGRMASGFQTLRIRAMLAGDAFHQARAGSLMLAGNTGRFVAPVGRMSAALQGLRAGAAGAGMALRRGLGGAMAMLGGPWGAALIAGAVLVSKYIQKKQEAKARVDEFTAALDRQTGALTRANREMAIDALEKSGALDSARELGISLEDVGAAATGNERAIARVNDQLDRFQLTTGRGFGGSGEMRDQADAANKLREAISGENEVAAASRKIWENKSAALRGATDATGQASSATQTYATKLAAARGEVQDLLDAENKRRLATVQAKRDQIALIETYAAARKEAREGKKTLDAQTQAGRNNWKALLDLSEQWNNSKAKVTNARGAYEQMRRKFVDVAVQMGATKKRAEEMAETFLKKVPRNVKTEVTTPGMEKALADLQRLENTVNGVQRKAGQLKIGVGQLMYGGPRATGGPVTGRQTYLVGERGPELFTPSHSGRIIPNHQVNKTINQGVTLNHYGNIVAPDPRAYHSWAQRRSRRRAGGGI